MRRFHWDALGWEAAQGGLPPPGAGVFGYSFGEDHSLGQDVGVTSSEHSSARMGVGTILSLLRSATCPGRVLPVNVRTVKIFRIAKTRISHDKVIEGEKGAGPWHRRQS